MAVLSAARNPRTIAVVLGTAAICFVLFDRPVARAVAEFPPTWIDAFRSLTGVGHSAKYIVSSAIAFAMFHFVLKWHRAAHAAALLFGSIVVPGLLVNLVKMLVGRLRPHRLIEAHEYGFHPLTFDYESNSFPSGHSSTMFGIALALSLLFPRWRWLWMTLAVTVAVSRVIVLAHYPSDTIVGAWIGVTLGAAWATWLSRRYGMTVSR